MTTIRENLEKWEEVYLSPYASLSKNSLGRLRDEEPCDIRPVFQRDRDRIDPDKAAKEQELLQGEIGSSTNPPAGCRFHPRCPYARESCRHEEPEMLETSPGSGHMAACPVVVKKEEARS